MGRSAPWGFPVYILVEQDRYKDRQCVRGVFVSCEMAEESKARQEAEEGIACRYPKVMTIEAHLVIPFDSEALRTYWRKRFAPATNREGAISAGENPKTDTQPQRCANHGCRYWGKCKHPRDELDCARDIETELGIHIERCANCGVRVWRARHNQQGQPFCATCSNEEQGRVPFSLAPGSCANGAVQRGWHT